MDKTHSFGKQTPSLYIRNERKTTDNRLLLSAAFACNGTRQGHHRNSRAPQRLDKHTGQRTAQPRLHARCLHHFAVGNVLEHELRASQPAPASRKRRRTHAGQHCRKLLSEAQSEHHRVGRSVLSDGQEAQYTLQFHLRLRPALSLRHGRYHRRRPAKRAIRLQRRLCREAEAMDLRGRNRLQGRTRIPHHRPQTARNSHRPDPPHRAGPCLWKLQHGGRNRQAHL